MRIFKFWLKNIVLKKHIITYLNLAVKFMKEKLFCIFRSIMKSISSRAGGNKNCTEGKIITLSEKDWIKIDLKNNLEKVTNDYLVQIVKEMAGYEDVSTALLELSNRRDERCEELNFEILAEEKGDQYLRAISFGHLYTQNRKEAL